MNAFEKEIGKTFQDYRDRRIAHVYFLYPPMRAAGLHGHMPCYIPTGRAPYDVGGFFYDRCGTSIGAELKETKDHENRLPLVGPEKKGNGLQYHQLESLVELHNSGGTALLLWSNGGEVGLLTGEQLAVAKLGLDLSLKAEAAKKEVAKGARSILWAAFRQVKDDAWLPKFPGGCKRGQGAEQIGGE